MKQSQQGFILVTTLMITTLFVFLATYISYRTLVFSSFAQTSIERQKAYSLALSGIQVGIALISNAHKGDDDQIGNETQQAQALLSSLLPSLNRWKTFKLTESTDGIDGEIKISISSEEGKINLNEIYDFQTHTFKGEDTADNNWKTLLQILFARISERMKAENIFDAFVTFLSKQDKPLDDITQLLQDKAFAPFKDLLFYQPPEDKNNKERSVYLTDLFTLWSGISELQPWLFSGSLSALLNLPPAQVNEIDKRGESVRKWLESFTLQSNWPQDWDTRMVPVYGRDIRSLPKSLNTLMAPTFAAHVFSILSQSSVGQVKQQLLAIVERVTLKAQEKTQFEVKIRKLYWL
jgi:hypothetical protein